VLKRSLKMFSYLLLLILLLGSVILLVPRLIIATYARSRIVNAEKSPSRPVAIVFGAGLWRDGSPTPVLRDRVATAASLYFAGKVEKLLMSGDNRFANYNEPAAMRLYALDLGVPDQAIVLDYAGRRTYDTCYRARDIFEVHQAILITQSFHLPRAIFLCEAMGVSVVGVPADLRQYRRSSLLYWNLRELPATLTALWEAYVTHPQPVLGNPEPIFPPEAQ
jgi:SanA protein